MSASDKHRGRVPALLDIEVTNYCNARCVMCPRDKMPPLGSMDRETWKRVVDRAVEYGPIASFAIGGLGEPLMHRQIGEFIAMAADAGLKPSMITNGSLLTEDMARTLVKAGLANVNVSIGGYRKTTYEQVQVGLNFETVYRNLLRFLEISHGRTNLNVQISPTVESLAEAEDIAAYWRSAGAAFCTMFPQSSNRGGALDADNKHLLHKDNAGGQPLPRGVLNIETLLGPSRLADTLIRSRAPFPCAGKDYVTFIGWEGMYYVCNSDFQKTHPLGSVMQMSLEAAYQAKAGLNRENCGVCACCTLIGRNPPPRGLSFYVGVPLYLVGTAWARFRGRRRHPDLD